MNSKDLFNAMGGIDENLIVRAQRKEQVSEMTQKNIIFKRLIPVAACFAVAIAAIFGFTGNGHKAVGTASLSETTEPHFGLLIASAADDDISFTEVERGYNVILPYECTLKMERVNGLTIEQKNEVFRKMAITDRDNVEKANKTYTGETSLSESENIIYAIFSFDYFTFAIDDPTILDRIVVSGSGNYVFTKNSAAKSFSGFQKGREMTISGDEYRNDKTVGFSWRPSLETIKAFEDDPNMKVSDIKDRLVFTVYYNDGTSEEAAVDISFDDNGVMKAVCNSK